MHTPLLGIDVKKYRMRRNLGANWTSGNSRAILDENETIRNELALIKKRNNRLIEQLREKSMEHSKMASQMSSLQKQMEVLQNRCRLNEELEKLSLNSQVIAYTNAAFDNVEEKLKDFGNELQTIKTEMMKNEQAAVNQTVREQNAYQTCLEHTERLQRDNFSMMQSRSSNFGSYDCRIRQLLEMMPSYDALYSFTVSVVRKLGQLRTSYIEKSAQANRSNLEMMHAQTSLLIAHVQLQLEKLKLQLHAVAKCRPLRPASYHGDDLLEKMVSYF
ncbi:unnamed protein product [Gongylonema pulchrum]|uniref:Uncharacterized protein n=1 Tax=Gongylonema pulchrum TaxID=637853 RepID=A0A183CY18_9BILA|nr:unnamed protein product [Gongylonema pulchrum]